MARISLIEKGRAAIVLRSLYEYSEKQFGAVPNLFKAMAHRPELLVTFANFCRELWTGGGVDLKTKEIAALRTAFLNGCDYCSTRHSASAQRAGLSGEQIAALRDGQQQSSAAFSEREKAAARLAEKITTNAKSITDEDIRQLKRWFSEADLVELSLVIGTMNLTSRFNECFAMELEALLTGK